MDGWMLNLIYIYGWMDIYIDSILSFITPSISPSSILYPSIPLCQHPINEQSTLTPNPSINPLYKLHFLPRTRRERTNLLQNFISSTQHRQFHLPSNGCCGGMPGGCHTCLAPSIRGSEALVSHKRWSHMRPPRLGNNLEASVINIFLMDY
eukprot:Protomagalhaensia_wolfi_Nauph_80__2@NODE_1002_length_1819_cov_76_449438_g758_i0_p2_GENE_NODE_1002_length_1819_cov_76_449438_g758_i0NODE_1002_length_1819_cov_76_449438_g758_i0_p2_ORF_typecomplete_len151_score3_02_NODE_1002_length_1819_cov_76_449438_g758_i011501602